MRSLNLLLFTRRKFPEKFKVTSVQRVKIGDESLSFQALVECLETDSLLNTFGVTVEFRILCRTLSVYNKIIGISNSSESQIRL